MNLSASLRFRSDRVRLLAHSTDLPVPLIASNPLKRGIPSPRHSHPYTSVLQNYKRYGNINTFPINYDFRPRLRGRLTLG